MIRNVDLINHLPQYLQNYKHLKLIMERLTPEIQLLEDETEIIKDNQFIANCNETGISMFENLLEIYPSRDDELQTRIDRVLFKWLVFPPYTLRYLVNVLNDLYGVDNYEIIEDFKNYEFDIKFINNFTPSGIVAFYDYIGGIKPANLGLNLSMHSTENTTLYAGVTLKGKYVKTTFYLDRVSIDSFSKDIDIFSNVLISSNYLKEVINIE